MTSREHAERIMDHVLRAAWYACGDVDPEKLRIERENAVQAIAHALDEATRKAVEP
jgi:precorrin isomerase